MIAIHDPFTAWGAKHGIGCYAEHLQVQTRNGDLIARTFRMCSIPGYPGYAEQVSEHRRHASEEVVLQGFAGAGLMFHTVLHVYVYSHGYWAQVHVPHGTAL